MTIKELFRILSTLGPDVDWSAEVSFFDGDTWRPINQVHIDSEDGLVLESR